MAEERKVVFRFHADAEKVKKAYAETKGMIKNLKAQLKELQKTIKNTNKKTTKSTKEETKKSANIFKKFTKQVKDNFTAINNKYGAVLAAMTRRTTTMSSQLGRIFRRLAFTLATVFSVVALVNFGREAISLASDLEEVQNVVEVSFGNMQDQVEEFSKSAMKNFGLTELQAKQMASTFMSMGKSMGLKGQTGTDMALALTGMVGDVSSFRNMSAEEVQTALNGVYTGETESLKRLGVVMTETNLKQFALTQGLSDNIQAMEQSEKVMLRYKFVMNSLQDAQGDFVRTSNSWANQVRQLSGLWTNFKAIVGNSLKTVFTPLLTVFNKILNDLTSIASVLNNSIIKLNGGIVQSSAKAAASIAATTSEILGESDAIDKANESTEEGLASFDKINTIGSEDSSVGGGISASATDSTIIPEVLEETTQQTSTFSRITDVLLGKWEKVKTTFKNAFAGVDWTHLKSSMAEFGVVGSNAFDWIIEKLAIFSRWFLEVALPHIIDFANQAIPLLTNVINAINWETLGKMFLGILIIITKTLEKINVFAQEHPEAFKIIVNCLLVMITALKIMLPIVIGFVSVLLSLSTLIPTLTAMKGGFVAISGVLAKVAAAVFSSTGLMVACVVGIVAGLWWIVTNWEEVVDSLTFLVQFWIYTFKQNWGALFEFIKNLWTNVFTFIKGIWTKVFDTISNVIEKITTKITNFGDKIKSIFSAIPTALKIACNLAIGVLNNLINKANRLKITIPSSVPGIGGESIGLNIPNIPMLKDGGVVNQPTLAMFGEYPGARNNPEVTAPEAKLRSIYREENSTLELLLSQILQVLLTKEDTTIVQIGEQQIEAIISRLLNKQNYRRNPRTT